MLFVTLSLPSCSDPAAPRPPEGRLTSAEAKARGRGLFLEHCDLCHGEQADGRGVRRHALSGPAANFTSATWRRGTSPEEIYRTTHEGVQGTSMPSWRMLGDDEIWDLVAYVWSVGAERR